jgi:hydroxyacylglutathione hydrolase
MRLAIHQFGYNDDNYGVLLHDPQSGETALVDAGDAAASEAALADLGWPLTQIWITHHHGDHVAGLAELAGDAVDVFGPCGVDHVGTLLAGGDSFAFAGREVEVIATPGHTLDMLNFYLPAENLVFTGDTLFAMGCGRLFEGDAPMMWNSLETLMALPDDTVVYCAHEYTAANARFALSVDPGNDALQRRAAAVEELRAAGQPTVPTLMALEKATNPFLRAGDPAIRAHLGMMDDGDAAVFGEIRARKDSF